ncbi:MAG: NUDIX domain-containing protein [candidate division Zixibacteria bacterium]|nr:NUDIX domain-containing protein [candidate division Zixibacteria bacterium]
MRKKLIRPIAICIIINDGKIFVFEGTDPIKNETFYRPLGGAIEFGERGEVAVKREFREEIKAELADLEFKGVFENIFTYQGNDHHEIVMVYQGKFADESFYRQTELTGYEDDGSAFRCLWKPLESFRAGKAIIYPDRLLKMIENE